MHPALMKMFLMGVVAGWSYQKEINAVVETGVELGVKALTPVAKKVAKAAKQAVGKVDNKVQQYVDRKVAAAYKSAAQGGQKAA